MNGKGWIPALAVYTGSKTLLYTGPNSDSLAPVTMTTCFSLFKDVVPTRAEILSDIGVYALNETTLHANWVKAAGVTEILTENALCKKLYLSTYYNRGHHIKYDFIDKIAAATVITCNTKFNKTELINTHNLGFNRMVMVDDRLLWMVECSTGPWAQVVFNIICGSNPKAKRDGNLIISPSKLRLNPTTEAWLTNHIVESDYKVQKVVEKEEELLSKLCARVNTLYYYNWAQLEELRDAVDLTIYE